MSENEEKKDERETAAPSPSEETVGMTDEQEDEEKDTPEIRDPSEEILALFRQNPEDAVLLETLSDYHENDIASVIPELTEDERRRLWKLFDEEWLGEIFGCLDVEDAQVYLAEMGRARAAEILSEMEPDEAANILDELDEEASRALVGQLDEDARHDIDLIRSYDEGEIGSIMTTNMIVFRHGIGVKDAMRELTAQAADNDNISKIYVVEEDGTFYGTVDLSDLIRTRAGVDLDEITYTAYPFAYDTELISESIERLREYGEPSLPVLDEDKKLLGVLTSDDMAEAAAKEFEEDYAKLGGLLEEEDLREPLLKSVRKRLPWLIVLLFLGILVSTVSGIFEKVAQEITVLVFFQSLILDMAGNAGTQSLAVTVRVISGDGLSAGEQLRFAFKEIRVALLNGVVMGLLSFLFVGAYLMITGKALAFAFAVSGCISAALMLAMTVAGFVGAFIPMLIKRFGADPAVASGPLITTLNDLIGVVSYYGLAWILLLNVLGYHG